MSLLTIMAESVKAKDIGDYFNALRELRALEFGEKAGDGKGSGLDAVSKISLYGPRFAGQASIAYSVFSFAQGEQGIAGGILAAIVGMGLVAAPILYVSVKQDYISNRILVLESNRAAEERNRQLEEKLMQVLETAKVELRNDYRGNIAQQTQDLSTKIESAEKTLRDEYTGMINALTESYEALEKKLDGLGRHLNEESEARKAYTQRVEALGEDVAVLRETVHDTSAYQDQIKAELDEIIRHYSKFKGAVDQFKDALGELKDVGKDAGSQITGAAKSSDAAKALRKLQEVGDKLGGIAVDSLERIAGVFDPYREDDGKK